VMGGMVTATVLAVFLVPVFFVVIRRLFPTTGHEAPHGTTIGSAAVDAALNGLHAAANRDDSPKGLH